MMTVAMTHVGNGVVIVGRSGAVYHAATGETVNLLPIDADGLSGHPEWVEAETDIEDLTVLEGDTNEYS